jgi:monothiol glutaredoxin
MSLSEATREKIQQQLDRDRVVLFMKGNPSQPLCGFSARTAGILDSLLDSYATVDVLADEEIREGIKVFGQWPTIPQLYVDGELVGGCDIVTAMFNNGELHEHLGLPMVEGTQVICVSHIGAGSLPLNRQLCLDSGRAASVGDSGGPSGSSASARRQAADCPPG